MELLLFYRQLKWRIGIRSPIVANVKLTNSCNLRCKMCSPAVRTEGLDIISTERWKMVLFDAKRNGIRIIVFEGGEPTLRKDLGDILSFCKEIGLFTILITNGVNDFSAYNPNALWVSIDGTEEYHNKTRGANVFKKIKLNLDKSNHPKKMILSTLNSDNINSVFDFVQEFSSYPIYFNWAYNYRGTALDDFPLDQRIESAKKLISLKKQGFKIFNSNKSLEFVGKKKRCNDWLMRSIDSGGNQFDGCMVARFNGSFDCKKCDLACYIELNNLYAMDAETRQNWTNFVGYDLVFFFEKLH